MTELRLYKGVSFDGVSVFPYFASKSAFDTYMDGKQTYSQDVHFNRIGDPILLNMTYDDAIGYSYASLNTGERTYFLTVTEVSVNENNRVYMGYTVDWYTTLFYEGEISFRRCHLIKSTSADPKKYPQSISPRDMRLTSQTTLLGNPDQPSKVLNGLLISYVTDDTKSALSYIYSPLIKYSSVRETNGTRESISLQDVFSGGLTSITGIAPKDIVGIWYLPYSVSYLGMREVGTDDHYWFELDFGPSWSRELNVSLTTDAMQMGVITDPSGSVLYSVPYGRTLKKIYYRIVSSWTQVFAELFFIYENGIQTGKSLNAVENSSILVPCPQVDFNNDAYANWTSGMKGIEIEERRIQKNKALVQNISGSVMTGAVGGAGGGPVGAAAGVAGQVATSLVSYGVDTYYENKINALEDQKYQHMQDTMIPGSFLMTGDHNYQIIQLSAYPDDMARYAAELSNFGADCNLPLSSWTPSVGAYKFADVEIVADVPYSIKQAIKSKMISGIKIVGV